MYLQASSQGEQGAQGQFRVEGEEQRSKRRKALGACAEVQAVSAPLSLLGNLNTLERATDALLRE